MQLFCICQIHPGFDQNTAFDKNINMYDTHAHLDILLERLKQANSPLIASELKIDADLAITENPKAELQLLSKLLENHELLVQATVSTSNYKDVTGRFRTLSQVKFLQGSHPEIVDGDFDIQAYMQVFDDELSNNNTDRIGIGEVGLDYYYSQDRSVIETQKKLFESMIQRSLEMNLPLIIHCREAFDDLFEIIDKYPKIHGNFLIHCFTGGINDLDNVLKRGGLVAYGGIITFGKNAEELRETVVKCPVNSMVLETDLPFLAPTPYRGQVCLPNYIQEVAKKAAELKSMNEQEIWAKTRQNVNRFFGV
jgi:TatD DNase family protein